MKKRFQKKHLFFSIFSLALIAFSPLGAAKNHLDIDPHYQSLQSKLDTGPGYTVNFTNLMSVMPGLLNNTK